MNSYEKERMKLWREVYASVIKNSHKNFLDAREEANTAVSEFDQQFKGES
jgi:hypothetical protein